ncbi:MAG TPA: hypothetical protein VMU36_07280 [Spirochaetia bacterium]|nr:hypothetical protein [Spirochaetia bacterium]
MSSRSFRRRNNRRKHNRGSDAQRAARQGDGGREDRPHGPDGSAEADGAPPAGAGNAQQRDGPNGAERVPPPPNTNGPGPHGNPQRGHRRHPGSRRSAGGQSDAPRRAAGADPNAPPPAPLVFPDCPICRQPVRELPSALTHRETGQPAHFDCIMRELRDSNELAPQEKICYLGGGSFGILEFRAPGAPSRFVIRKRIQYEGKDAAPEWKKVLLISL